MGIGLPLLLAGAPARAVEIGEEGSITSVEVHGFASQGFILSRDNNYLSANSTHGSFQFSEAGINFTKDVVDRLRVGVQLFAQDLGPAGNYTAKFDWFYLDYRYRDWLGFRAGRVKVPFGLYNEINDIDSARVWILLPQSVYPVIDRDFLLAQTGGELYGYLRLGAAGALDYRAYGGTIFVDPALLTANPAEVGDITVPYLVGGRLLWETPLDGLRVGGSLQALRIDIPINLAGQTVLTRIPAILSVGSIEYSAHDFLVAAEYSRWYVSADSSNPAIIPEIPLVTSERAYATANYRANKWFQAGAYYSLFYPDVTMRDGRQNFQHDLSATLRFDVNSNWLWKIEGHYMIGTAGVSSALNDNAPLSSLSRNWSVLLIKTTAYF